MSTDLTEISETLGESYNRVKIISVLADQIPDEKRYVQFGKEVLTHYFHEPEADCCIDFQNVFVMTSGVLTPLENFSIRHNQFRGKPASLVGLYPHFFHVMETLRMTHLFDVRENYSLEDFKRDRGYA